MTERSAQKSDVDSFVKRALEELFSGSTTDTWAQVLNRDLANRGSRLRRVKNPSVPKLVPLKSKSEAA